MTNLPVPSLSTPTVGFPISQSYLTNQLYNPLTFALNPPVFYGVQTATQTLSTGSNTAITLDTGVVDTYGGHSNTTNNTRYTAQVAGYYLISGCVGYATNATGFRNANLRVNGTSIQGGTTELPASSSSFAVTLTSPTVIKFLNVGDYVEIWGWQTSGGNLTTVSFGDQASSLTVRWLHI